MLGDKTNLFVNNSKNKKIILQISEKFQQYIFIESQT